MNVKVTTGGNLHVGLWGAWFQLTVSEARELATLLLEQAAQAEEKALDLAQQAEASKLARQREQAEQIQAGYAEDAAAYAAQVETDRA